MIRKEYAIYNCNDYQDVCIVDSLGRWTLVHRDDWEQFVEDALFYNPFPPEHHEPGTTFKEMQNDHINQKELDRLIDYYEDRRNL